MLSQQPSNHSLILFSSIHKRRYYKNSGTRPQQIPGDMLCVIIQGRGLLRLDQDVVPLQPHHAFYLKPSMNVEVIPESGYVEYYMMMFSHVTVSRKKGSWKYDRSHSETSILPAGTLHVKSGRPLLEQIHRFYQESHTRTKADGALQLHFQSLIRFILQDLPEDEDIEDDRKGIDQSIGYMYKHFHEKIKMDTLSYIAGLTQTSYSRSFKRAKGVSPVEYLNRIRVEHAKQLLQENYSIKEVSQLVGVGNEFYFSRMFKKETGVTPTLYIQRKQLKVAVATCFRYQDNLCSLGMDTIVFMNAYLHEGRSAADFRQWIQDQMNTIRQAAPDLIIADYRHLPYVEDLKKIAPTLVLEYVTDWRKNHRRIAELVGREKEAQHNFIQVEQKVKYARHILKETMGNGTISLIRQYNDKIRLQGTVGHPINELLYTELGLKPGSCVPVDVQNKVFTWDRIPPFETDHLFIYKMPGTTEEAGQSGLLQASWSGMKALRYNRIRYISNWISLSWTPSGQHQIIDELLSTYT